MFTFFWSRKRLQETIDELKEQIQIEEALIRLSIDPQRRIECEDQLMELNNVLYVLEKKLAKKKH